MKIGVGIVFLVFGFAVFGKAVANFIPDASLAFNIGNLLPSILIIAAGIYILTKSSKKHGRE